MSDATLLSGITQHMLQTTRLKTGYLQAGNGRIPVVLVHGNVSSALFFQPLMQTLAATGHYTIYAPDMRGYGASEAAPVDATRGVRDFSDDLSAFVNALDLTAFHLLGWSLGGNVVMQYVMDYPAHVRTLVLESAGSPFGFGGTKDVQGTPTWPDFAGSGGGTANPDFVQRLARGDRSDEPGSPRNVMNTFYFKPPFRVTPELEEIYVTAMLSTVTGNGNYPGDTTASTNWPLVAPGTQGVNNALAPAYLNQAALAAATAKPPILWIHGADDQIVSDYSFFDLGVLGELGLVPGWPGRELYPPQPMKSQVRAVLEHYQQAGGSYREVVIPDCGHSPHVEKQDAFVQLLTEFFV